jgi:homocysteine S-methyltransferase
MHAAGEEGGRSEGIAIAREFLESVKGDVSGVYVMPPFADYDMAADVIRAVRPLG